MSECSCGRDQAAAELAELKAERDDLLLINTDLRATLDRSIAWHEGDDSPHARLDQELAQLRAELDEARKGWVGGFIEWVSEKIEWSYKTFGMAERAEGVCQHIEKELAEIRADPHDIKEWIDVILLALDGACRTGHKPKEVVEALIEKQSKNTTRAWPPISQEDKPIFHIKDAFLKAHPERK
jgi:hypothetical protein